MIFKVWGYIFIYFIALELDVVMVTFLPVDFSKANFPKVFSYQSLVYKAALLQARVPPIPRTLKYFFTICQIT